jgi:hypothetical protein
MKRQNDREKAYRVSTWEEESGFLKFLATVPSEVEQFNRTLGFDFTEESAHPSTIDGSEELSPRTAFVITRTNRLIPEKTYCLYAVLRERTLHGYIGLYRDGEITTLRELEEMRDFREGGIILYDWLRGLVKASCDK